MCAKLGSSRCTSLLNQELESSYPCECSPNPALSPPPLVLPIPRQAGTPSCWFCFLPTRATWKEAFEPNLPLDVGFHGGALEREKTKHSCPGQDLAHSRKSSTNKDSSSPTPPLTHISCNDNCETLHHVQENLRPRTL